MKQLPVRFSTKQTLQIDGLSDATSVDKSQVARAAMQIGLDIIRKHDQKNSQLSKSEFIVINDLKALN